MPQMMVGRPPTNSEAGTKLYISNLDYEVTNEDIKVTYTTTTTFLLSFILLKNVAFSLFGLVFCKCLFRIEG